MYSSFCVGSPSPNPSKWNGIAHIYGRSSMAQLRLSTTHPWLQVCFHDDPKLAKLPRLTITSGIVAHSINSRTQESESCRFELATYENVLKRQNLPCEHPTPRPPKPMLNLTAPSPSPFPAASAQPDSPGSHPFDRLSRKFRPSHGLGDRRADFSNA